MTPDPLQSAALAETRARPERMVAAVGVLFFLSGATSLTYQVGWTRMLSLFFGSDIYAAAITLSVFMCGLSAGSWIGGRWGDRLSRPLMAYGICEIAIAGGAFLFPIILGSFEGTYQEIYRARFETDPDFYHGFRLMVAATALAVPTMLMGATLPLLVREFAVRQDILGRRVGLFYAINTVGALGGTLMAGFVLLSMLGVNRTIFIALIVNVLIGLVAIFLSLRNGESPVNPAPAKDETAPQSPSGSICGRVIVVMTLSGLAALALEVVWMRVLVQSFSATVYAFSIMLSCFLFGIFYGSHKVSKTIDGHKDPRSLLMWLELWLGAAVAVLAVLTYIVPGLFGKLVWGLTGVAGGAFGTASILAQFVVAALLIIAPTVMLGATFPVAVKLYTEDVESRARSTGAIYAANTAGAVIGALLAGFVLLPALGSRGSLLIIAVIFLAAGSVLAIRESKISLSLLLRPKYVSAFALVAVSAAVVAVLPPQTVINFNLQRSTTPDVVFHGEGVSHTVDIIKSDSGHTIMMINGNIEADTTLLQRRHFILKGHLPLLLHPNPKDVAVVGLGLGVTLAATANHPTVENIRLVELSPEMVAAHGYIRDITGNILSNPKIKLRIDDGRNFMAMTDEKFDMITADPVHPRITGVGYLYTYEYYEQIKQRLRPDGVVTQWMPMYRISSKSFRVAFRTFVQVFPNASFWYVRGHGLFVATKNDTAIDFASLAARFSDPAVTKDFASIGIDSPASFLGHLLMDSEQIKKYLAASGDKDINTDDNAYLEYNTPFEFMEQTEKIVSGLLPFAGWDIDRRLRNASESVMAEVRSKFEGRLKRIKPELTEPIQ